jgi:hypothetical protein
MMRWNLRKLAEVGGARSLDRRWRSGWLVWLASVSRLALTRAFAMQPTGQPLSPRACSGAPTPSSAPRTLRHCSTLSPTRAIHGSASALPLWAQLLAARFTPGDEHPQPSLDLVQRAERLVRLHWTATLRRRRID